MITFRPFRCPYRLPKKAKGAPPRNVETQDAVDIAWREWRKARERRMMGDLAGAAEAERFALFWLQLPLWPGEPLIRELLEYEE